VTRNGISIERGHNLKGEKTDGQSDIPPVVDVEYPESEPRLTKDGTKRKGIFFSLLSSQILNHQTGMEKQVNPRLV
jgi:hypothetical protein